MRLAGGFEPGRPVGEHVAARRLRLGVDRRGQLADLAGLDGQVDGADRRHFRLRLDRLDGAAHADDAVEQPLPQRPQLAAVVGQFGQALVEDGDAVEYAVEIALQMHRRRLGPFRAGRGHRDQMAGEIAAVDARHVERIERPQRRRLVPVEQMAAMALHLLDRRHRRVDAAGRIGEADPAEIARRNDRQQIDADIGRRGSRRHDRVRRFLEIVRRQHVVLGRDEGLEIGPGAARDRAQHRRVGGRDVQPVLGLGRAADQPGEGRRAGPEQEEEEADESAGGIGGHRNGQPDQRDDDGAVHHRGSRSRGCCRPTGGPARRCAIRAGSAG